MDVGICVAACVALIVVGWIATTFTKGASR
jgi:hypothetical protein